MSLNFYLMDPDGEAAREAHRARLREAALMRLVRAGQPTLRERTAGLLVALAARLAPSLGISVARRGRSMPSFGA